MRNPSIIRRLPPNPGGRDFYIGDLHGCTDHLERLLEHVRFDASADRLISVGDLVDRGPDSMGASALIEKPWFFAVLGNHEVWSLAVLGVAPFSLWQERLRYRDHLEWHSKLSNADRTRLIDRLRSLPLGLEVEQPRGRFIGVIHAQLPIRPGWTELYRVGGDDLGPTSPKVGNLVWDAIRGRDQASIETALGLRNPAGYERWLSQNRRALQRQACRTAGVGLLISGHVITPGPQPVAIANRVSIDTGAYRPLGVLTMLEPSSRRYWQVGWRKSLKTPLYYVHGGTLAPPFSAWDARLSLRRILSADAAEKAVPSPGDLP